MFSIVITEKSGAQRQLDFDVPELTIGRLEGNDLVLPRSNVSKRHAQLVLKDDRYVVVDLGSTNGTYVNGRRISAPMVVRKGDKIYIGDFIVGLARSVEEQRDSQRKLSPGLEAPAPQPQPQAQPQPPAARARGATKLGQQAAEATRPDELSYDDYDDDEDLDTVMGAPVIRPVSKPPPPPSDGIVAPAPPRGVPHSAPGARNTLPAEPPVMTQPPPSTAPATPEVPRSKTFKAPAKSESKPEGAPESTAESTAESTPRSNAGSTSERRPARISSQPGLARGSFPPRLEDPESAKTSPAVLAPSVRLQGALATLMEQLADAMDVKGPTESAFPSEQDKLLDKLIDDLSEEGIVGPDLDRRFLRESAICEAVGLGPLDRLLSNHAVREVVVDGPSRILANLGGELSPVSMFFSSEEAIVTVARRLLARAGRSLQDDAPVQSGVLPDGTQVELLLPPLSVKGPLITIRCPAKTPASADGLVTEGILSTEMLETLRTAMRRRDNVLVVGGPGAGVSLLLSAMAGMAQEHERVVTIEESPNMAIAHPQVLPLSRAKTELTIDSLLGLATRLHYDRLVVDDLRPADALGMLLHASTGPGVLMGLHAASARSALKQLELFSQREMGGPQGSLAAIMGEAIRLIVHVQQARDGNRRVVQMTEVQTEGDAIKLHTLFKFDGRFRATEHAAAFRD